MSGPVTITGSWLIVRETLVDRTSLPTKMVLSLLPLSRRGESCGGTGIVDTGNNELPCACPLGDVQVFNGPNGQETGAELKARGVVYARGTVCGTAEIVKIIEVRDTALWSIEQRHEFREARRSTDHWHVNTSVLDDDAWRRDDAAWRRGSITPADGPLISADEPHAHNPYVVHRVISPAHALVSYSRALGIVRIYVAEMIPAEDRAVALDACLHNDQESLRRANRICEQHATTEMLAHLALDTIIIEANLAREHERTASYL